MVEVVVARRQPRASTMNEAEGDTRTTRITTTDPRTRSHASEEQVEEAMGIAMAMVTMATEEARPSSVVSVLLRRL